ncbi:MAG: ATP-dependent helicase, partial [Desulfobacterales bacterium]|nr:ATP-dependent helicase [Desulfobacterales bacterium]
TFTAAAAKNMRDRISDFNKPDLYLSYKKQPKHIRTMHSLGYKIVRENATAIGLKDIVKVVTSERLRNILIGDAAQLAGHDRNDGKESERCRQFGVCNFSAEDKKCQICRTYKSILRSCSAIDYDEQILLACDLLRENAELLAKYQSQCRHLLIDEYQDINAAQFNLINMLSNGQRDGLFVVGDDDQSIYSWRGGSPEFIRGFEKFFGEESRIETLRKSYRCHKNVLEGSMSIVKKFDAHRRNKGEFEYAVEDGPKIQIHNAPSDDKEAVLVRSIVERVLPSMDVLILFPHKSFSSAVTQELRKAGIGFSAPFVLPGEGLPLISVLSDWLVDYGDSLAFRELLEALIDNPASGIPSRLVRKAEKKEERQEAFRKISCLWERVIKESVPSLWGSLDVEKENDVLYRIAFDKFSEVLALYNNTNDPASFVAQIINTLVPWKQTSGFLKEVDSWVDTSALFSSRTQGTDVQLMTLQGAKGLEAKVVCVIGLEDGIIPKGDADENALAEQSRLMFVSMTRAIVELHLFHARKRSGGLIFKSPYKKGGPPDINRSRFLGYVPNEYKEDKYHPA